MAIVLKQVDEEMADVASQPVVTLGNHCLRARQHRVDYCELIDKPEQLYRLVPASKLPNNRNVKPEDASNESQAVKAAEPTSSHNKQIIPIPEPVAEEHVPVQLPEQVEPWPVWIKHTEKGLIAYALWINAVEMMKDPDEPGRFLLCSGTRYKPVRNVQPCTSLKLSDQVELMRPSNYRQCIKLGKAFKFPSGRAFEEGTPMLKVLQHAWPPGTRPLKAYVGNTYLPGGGWRIRLLGPFPRVRPTKPHKLRLSSAPKTSPLLESGEPVRVHVTCHKKHTTVYGLWTNAQAAIEAVQPWPLVFVQCEQGTYEPINPEVKYRNDRFYMSAGHLTCGGWRNAVKLDQQLPIPGGPTLEPGTSLAKVFGTLLKLRAEQGQLTALDQAPGNVNEGANNMEEAVGNEDEHCSPGSRNILVYNEQQDATTSWEVIVIDNSHKKITSIRNNKNNNNNCVRGRGEKMPAPALEPPTRRSKVGKTSHHGSIPQAATPHENNASVAPKAAKPGKSKSNKNGSCSGGKKRLVTTSEPGTNKAPAKRAKVGSSETATTQAEQGKDDNITASPAGQQPRLSSKPATVTEVSKPSPQAIAAHVKMEGNDVLMANALPEQKTQQQCVLVSLPELSVDAQFHLQTDCARQLLTSLASLLQSLNYGEQQAKQLWKGYKKAFLKDGNSRACTSRRQEWATNYIQLVDAVESRDPQHVRSVLEDLFGVAP